MVKRYILMYLFIEKRQYYGRIWGCLGRHNSYETSIWVVCCLFISLDIPHKEETTERKNLQHTTTIDELELKMFGKNNTASFL